MDGCFCIHLWVTSRSIALCLLLPAAYAAAQEIQLNPTRPTVANSAAIQSKGVLQIETGYDAFPGAMQTVDTGITYAATDRLRLDFTWSAFVHQINDDGSTTNGISTMELGGKVILHKEDYHRPLPGVSFQYEAELPTASNEALQDYGQQAILLINHHYGPSGDLDVIANGSIVQADCNTPTHCSYGGQQSFALSYHLNKTTRVYAEVYGQNVSQSNTSPGTYVFGGFYHQFSDTFGIDGGMRFGVTQGASSVGTTVGLVFGKRLKHYAAAQ